MSTQRLPVPGSDDGDWGDILNGYLEVAHNSDGTLTAAAVSAAGAVQVGGDLGGTSTSPTVAKLQGTTLSAPSGGATSFLNASGGWTTPASNGAQALAPTSIKTNAYIATAGDFIPVDASSGSVTITLPTAPVDKTRLEIKMIATSGNNSVTFNTGGSDVINKTGGATTGTLSVLNQAIMLQYASTGNIWYVQSDDLPLTQLDARYPQFGAYVASTISTTGPPVTGTWSTGQSVIDKNGIAWVCTAGGTPGTWAESSASLTTMSSQSFLGKVLLPQTNRTIDPTLPGPWSNTGMTINAGSYNSTYGAANAAVLALAFAYAATNGCEIAWPAGTWDIQGHAKWGVAIPLMSGAGVDTTTIRFQTGAGLTSGQVDGGTTSTSGLSVTTGDGLGCGLQLGNNTGNYAGPGGYLRDLTITSASGNAPQYSSNPSTAVGLCINGVTNMTLDRIRVSNFGVGYDFVNNCGGSEMRNCTTAYHDNCLGMNMRTGGNITDPTQTGSPIAQGSGSDIHLYNCWIHGEYGAICIENGATDLFVVGGQIACNHSNAQGLGTPADGLAAVIFNRSWLDGNIGSDGVPGTLPTPGTGAVGLVKFQDVDFEGTRGGFVMFRSYSAANVSFKDCNLIGYQSTGTNAVVAPYGTGGAFGCGGLFKMTGAGLSSVAIEDCTVKGCYVSTNLGQVAGATSPGFYYFERNIVGKQITCINGYDAGAALGGNWLANDVVNSNRTSLARFSGLSVPHMAVSGELIDLNGLILRNNSGVLQSSTDGSTWTSLASSGGHIVSSGSAPTVAAGTNNGSSPPTPTIVGNDTAGVISFGTGSTPTAGQQVVVTFAAAYAGSGIVVVLSAGNGNSKGLTFYGDGRSNNGFNISSGTPTASEAATYYQVQYHVIGLP